MCYVLLLSTTSSEDLAAHNSELVLFTKDLPTIAEVKSLKYPNKWYIGSKSGCSCSFRHLHSIELGFSEPVEWYKENPEDIEATKQLIQIIRDLVAHGERVDCIDAWEHQEMYPVANGKLEVDLSKVKNSEFRFFENHHFTFGTAT
jgi:hypothetical protein